uniref:Homing endonuclease LAGLIDADG domain-containing protein n=1 Tax=Ankistrodesmus stipitatus TaxID=3109 RepID=Q8WL10_9CHLO|nr:putative protein [Ankistrodesmus stipitatus]
MTLTQHQKELLVGTLLGDGNLQTETRGRTWRYRAIQKAEHKDYLFHKYEILKEFCSTEPQLSRVADVRTNKTYERWMFSTKVHDSLRFYGNLFYTYDNKTQRMVKDIPVNIEKFLTPATVAYWYMDDGSLKYPGKSNALRICTESFSDDGVRRLQRALKNLYGIEASQTQKNKIVNGNKLPVGLRIAINERASTAFRELIEPYLVDCMKYKVSDGKKGRLLVLKQANSSENISAENSIHTEG